MIGELISLLSHHIGTCVKAECTDGGEIPLVVLLQDSFPPTMVFTQQPYQYC